MPETRRKYDSEFREGAVGSCGRPGKPIAQVARELGINPGTLGNWVKKDRATAARSRPSLGVIRAMCVGSSGRTPSCGWSVMSSLGEYRGAGHRGLFVGSGEGRPRCLATGWPV